MTFFFYNIDRKRHYNKKNGKQPSLSELIGLLNYAKKDSSIKGIYIKCAENPNGYAATEEIRKALIDFKKSNKFISLLFSLYLFFNS